ncbi:holin [Microbacterium phage Pajaza]|uniref:Holin n=1 Tax=Microbacterium phage Pajaza TaxID=2099443 RepID=A0A2P1CIF2_9CAUD|nr:holin [Microbacterium phage Pajaza]
MEAITTIATVPAVIALVTLVKDLGLPSRLSPLAALVLGVALSLFAALAIGEVVNWYEPVAKGIILGLSASGLYDGARSIGTKKKTDTIVVQESAPKNIE